MTTEGVISTNDDAANCKRFAVVKGYWEDEFIQYFIRKIPDRKAPEINRGYYLRHHVVQSLVEWFLRVTNCKCQIVNIGAGYDTLYWNLMRKDQLPSCGLYELDLKQVVEKKMMYIKTKEQLSKLLVGEIIVDKNALHSKYYHLASCDITNVLNVNTVLVECGIDKSIPTLFLSECVFAYLPIEKVENLLCYVSSEFKTVMLIDYGPVDLNDAFGDVMKQNLRGRDCHLVGVHPNIQSIIKSYKMFQGVQTKLLLDLYNGLKKDEKARIEKIEFLDEIHLLHDLLKHYCISAAYNDDMKINLKSVEF